MNTPLKLKIALQDLPHKCERTLMVPDDINMRQLHFIIQEYFGWFNAHLFEFKDSKWKSTISVGMPDDVEMEWIGPPKQDAHTVSLKETFLKWNGAKPFWYWYDFGDDWWHKITFLKTSLKDLKQFEGSPKCLKAIGKCPPEDVGGPWGYAEFLEVIQNKKHPEHKEPGEVYDEHKVSLGAINQYLYDLYHSEGWQSNEYELF